MPFTGRFLLGISTLTLGVTLSACSQDSMQALLERSTKTAGLQITRDLSYGPDIRQKLDIYAPPNAKNAPVVLFIHGGSWNSNDKSRHQFVGDSLARAGYVTALMNYRLAPKNRYPTYVQDAASALKWLRDHAKQVGGNPDNLFVAGHSAGAFNAVEVVDNARWLTNAKVPISAIRGVIGIAGPYSFDFRKFPVRQAFPVNGNPDDIMPDRHVRPDAPPNLLLVAGQDEQVAPENALNMEAALKKAGVQVERRVLPYQDHLSIIGVVARSLTLFGGTRAEMIRFIEANRLK